MEPSQKAQLSDFAEAVVTQSAALAKLLQQLVTEVNALRDELDGLDNAYAAHLDTWHKTPRKS